MAKCRQFSKGPPPTPAPGPISLGATPGNGHICSRIAIARRAAILVMFRRAIRIDSVKHDVGRSRPRPPCKNSTIQQTAAAPKISPKFRRMEMPAHPTAHQKKATGRPAPALAENRSRPAKAPGLRKLSLASRNILSDYSTHHPGWPACRQTTLRRASGKQISLPPPPCNMLAARC
jgi:hypothetical protein